MGDRRYVAAEGGLLPGVEPVAAHRDGVDEERVTALLSEVTGEGTSSFRSSCRARP